MRKTQERTFRRQVGLACELGLPLIIHCRGAYASLIPILKEEKAHRVGGVVHNFDADQDTASALLDMGFLASFGGAITYPSATTLHKIARHIPLDGILLETDSPYMPLYEQTIDQNEPANVARLASLLAELKGIDSEELIAAVFTNFTRLLKISD